MSSSRASGGGRCDVGSQQFFSRSSGGGGLSRPKRTLPGFVRKKVLAGTRMKGVGFDLHSEGGEIDRLKSIKDVP